MTQEIKDNWREVVKAIAVAIVYGLLTLITFYIFFTSDSLVAEKDISDMLIVARLTQDIVIGLGFPLILLVVVLIREKSITSLGFTKKSPKVVISLAIIYVALFVFFGEKTLSGIYLWVYYLLCVAFAEELIFRGYLFEKIYSALNKEVRAAIVAGIISGLLWGALHSIIPIVAYDEPILASITSNLGGGIAGGAIFAFALYKSKSLYVPILIHAIFDYLGVIT